MTTFALDVNSSEGDIIAGLNYALANLGSTNGLTAGNVLTANITNGQITTTSSNSSGYTTTTIVSYLYQYMDVKYANSATGGSGFSSQPTLASYYGLRNTANIAVSNNPVDYTWYQVSGGFGTTKSLFYQTIGGRQVAFYAGTTAPQSDFLPVPSMPFANSTPINLDTITSAQNNQIVNINAYYQANIIPATPSGGTYNFTNFTLTPPSGWSATVPNFVANTSIYISSAAFTGNTNTTAAPPATTWTTPAVYSSQFQGNTGPQGQRGFVPMGYVITANDPTTYGNATLTAAYSSSRSNPSAPIGLGFAPIQYDTAQFAYTNLFTGNTTTIVKQYDGSGWNTVVGNVVSGGLIVPGSINANTLNVNQVYALTIASTNAAGQVGNIASPGFWMDNVSGDAHFGGNVTIGANLSVTGLITQGSLANNVVTTNNIQAAAVTSVQIALDAVSGDQIKATTINGTNIKPNTITGNLIAANTITGNLIAGNTITGNLIAGNTITGNLIQAGTITGNLIAANTITGNSIIANSFTANTINGNAIVANSFTANTINGNAIVAGSLVLSGNINSVGSTVGDYSAPGYWLENDNGSVRFGGTTSIGNNLTVGNNAQFGNSVIIGTNLTVGNNAVIGGNLNVTGLITQGTLANNTVATATMVAQAVSQGIGQSSGNNVGFNSPRSDNNTSSSVYYVYPYAFANIAYPSSTSTVYVNANFSGYLYTANSTQITAYGTLVKSTNGGSTWQALSKATYQFNPTASGLNQYFYINPAFTWLDYGFVGPSANISYGVAFSIYGTTANAQTSVTQLAFYTGTVVSQLLKR